LASAVELLMAGLLLQGENRPGLSGPQRGQQAHRASAHGRCGQSLWASWRAP